ncbi:hypothetical protein DPMN_179701 [Dreissena polymorpha]|uniref:Uncharacterized protein n=1 Tax=Dreissena polymorpha TaxID=45954 RepID=A0A9D4EEH5_DREPO|nr:hypothetical protein DPMN_179701 [Dreissena polymorpha]
MLDEENLLASTSDDDMDLGSDPGKLLESPRSSISTGSVKVQPEAKQAGLYQGGVGRGLLPRMNQTTGMPISLDRSLGL